ncbi:MAG TPA: hypothetical protein VJ441_01740 [Dehalococcoidia bacterium]|nr:hypothetical protein [Dehalococcoidia bacterium]
MLQTAPVMLLCHHRSILEVEEEKVMRAMMASNRSPRSRKLTKGTAIIIGTMLLTLALVLVFGVVGQVLASTAEALNLESSDAGGVYIESDGTQPTEFPANMTADRVTEEPARYNLASAQEASNLRVIPGGEAKGVIRFYNVDGNRITHITLEVVQAPDDWEVEITPPLHDTEVEFGGRAMTIAENLHVEPTHLSLEPIEDVPEGMVCLILGNRGYALAKTASIIVRIPESEKAGTEGDIKIAAVASWLGQTGMATICQTRDFDFTVKVV